MNLSCKNDVISNNKNLFLHYILINHEYLIGKIPRSGEMCMGASLHFNMPGSLNDTEEVFPAYLKDGDSLVFRREVCSSKTITNNEKQSTLLIGNFPECFDDVFVAKFLEQFGRLKSFQEVKGDKIDVNTRYVLCEYESTVDRKLAIRILDGFRIGNHKLIVKPVGSEGDAFEVTKQHMERMKDVRSEDCRLCEVLVQETGDVFCCPWKYLSYPADLRSNTPSTELDKLSDSLTAKVSRMTDENTDLIVQIIKRITSIDRLPFLERQPGKLRRKVFQACSLARTATVRKFLRNALSTLECSKDWQPSVDSKQGIKAEVDKFPPTYTHTVPSEPGYSHGFQTFLTIGLHSSMTSDSHYKGAANTNSQSLAVNPSIGEFSLRIISTHGGV